jgi:hypothetical protein
MRRLRKKKKFFENDIFIVGLVVKRHRFASHHLLKQLFQLFAKHHYMYDHIPGACTIKKLRIRNLRKRDKFHSKLVTFLLSDTFTGLDKHTSLLRNP